MSIPLLAAGLAGGAVAAAAGPPGSARGHPPAASAPVPPATPAPPSSDGTAGGIASTSDPLGANGLTSPLCRSSDSGLSVGTKANCRASGLSMAPVPISHYAFDIHIDTPLIPLAGDGMAIVMQDMLLTPVWTALVWLTHALLVGLEWCYSIDLLDSGAMGGIARSLGEAERLFTQAWLVVVLAIAAVGVTYAGLVRRRVTDSLGDVALMAAMMVAGLALIGDPRGTLGELTRLVNQASLGTLAAVSSGNPDQPRQALATGLEGVFDSSVQGPWCYMEFGDVAWCQDGGRLDPRLAGAARHLAATDRQTVQCPASLASGSCGPSVGSQQADLAREPMLVSRARTNGALVLAFAANGPARNAINDPNSLLHVLCGTYDATSCAGPTAAQAEFRTAAGTWPRAGGLLFILIGAAGMLVLLAFLALRLLAAALLTVFFLLLAPVVVLTPALGERGRGVFRMWLARLLGAALAKLVYSAFLGVVLLMVGLLASFGSLGWWTQWLLVSALWWTVFAHRNRVLEVATMGHRDMATRGVRMLDRARYRGSRLAPPRWPLRRSRASRARVLGGALERAREWSGRVPAGGPSPARQPGWPGGAAGTERRAGAGAAPGDPMPSGAQPEGATIPDYAPTPSGRPEAARSHPPPATRGPAGGEYGDSGPGRADRAGLPPVEARMTRLERERERALRTGDARRAARLAVRAQALRAATAAHQARQTPPAAGERSDTERFLDRQEGLRRGVPPGPRADPSRYRDYPNLAWLAGLSAGQYRSLDPAIQRQARLTVDRQLHTRAEYGAPRLPASGRMAPTGLPVIPGARRRPDRRPGARHGPPSSERDRQARQFLRHVRGSPPGRPPPEA